MYSPGRVATIDLWLMGTVSDDTPIESARPAGLSGLLVLMFESPFETVQRHQVSLLLDGEAFCSMLKVCLGEKQESKSMTNDVAACSCWL